MSNLFFDSEYKIWYHSITEKSWSKDSYINLCKDFKDEKINNSFDLGGIYTKLNNNFNAGMFFLMKKDILPLWEDPHNVNGGYWSLKIPKKKSTETWLKLSASFVGNTLLNHEKDMANITGISISPKISNCVIKVWVAKKNKIDTFNKKMDFIQFDNMRFNDHKKHF